MTKLVIVAAALALAGCKKKVDAAKYEAQLTKDLEGLGIKADKVKCPSGVKAEKGSTFTCQVTIEGKDFGFEATVDKVDGQDLGMSTHWTDGKGVVSHKVEGILTTELTPALGATTPDCGAPLRFLEADSTLACKVTAGGTTFDAKVTFDDALTVTSWALTPNPIITSRLVDGLQTSVSTKLGVPVTVKCGDQPFLIVPADNVITCDVTDAQKTMKLEVTFKPGTIEPESWEVVAP